LGDLLLPDGMLLRDSRSMRIRHILQVGPCSGTCLQRAEALKELGYSVTHIDAGTPQGVWSYHAYSATTKLLGPRDFHRANRRILRRASEGSVDLLWIDKGLTIRPNTLLRLRSLSPRSILVSYSPDDMGNPANQSHRYLKSIPIYDLHVTTKSYNCEELRNLGARDVLFVDNAYDPAVHRTIDLTPAERKELTTSVGFIGFFERDRADHILGLARAGVAVTVCGPGWHKLRGVHQNLWIRSGFLHGIEYSKAINATLINLAFLRKAHRDLQTTRSVEIPACGAFMLAERTDEHLLLFAEGKEAEFFGSFDELVTKCRYYLTHPTERERIAAAGLRRCIEADYSNTGMLRRVLKHLGVD